MKIRTHHFLCIAIGLLTVPLFAALWIAYKDYGSVDAWRPWLLLTSYGAIGEEAWTFALKIGGIGALGVIALLLYFFEGVLFGVNASDIHGTASWASRKDAKTANLMQPWGVVLGRLTKKQDESEIIRTSDVDYSVMLLSAPARSGKGIGVIIPTLLTYPGSFIVHDVKGENFEQTARRRKAMGDRVRVFAPFDMTLENGMKIEGRSHGFNPMIAIAADPDLERRITEIDVLASAFLTTANPKEEGLLSSGKEIFKAACAIVCAENKAPSIGKVVDLLSPESPDEDHIADLQLHMANLARRAPDPLSRQALVTASASKNENLALYLAVLFDCGLKAWRNPAIRRATEHHDFDFDQLRKFPYAIYLCIPTPFRDTAAPVIRLFFQLALRTIQDHLPDKETEPLSVLFLIDEFHKLGHMKEVLDAPTVIPGYGGRILAVVQTPASLDAIYGRDAARVFLDLTSVKVFMTPNDNGTNDMIEKTLGYRTVVSKSVSGKHLAAKTDRSQSFSEIRRPLMAADDIGKMPKDREIITVQGNKPVYGYRVRYFEDAVFQPIYESQFDEPWPIDDIPIVKSGIVEHMDQFLDMSANGRGATAEAGDEKVVAFPSHEAQETAAAPEAAPRGSESAFENESEAELTEAALARFEAIYDGLEDDLETLRAYDVQVNGEEGAEIARLIERLSPEAYAARIAGLPDDEFSARPDPDTVEWRARVKAEASETARERERARVADRA